MRTWFTVLSRELRKKSFWLADMIWRRAYLHPCRTITSGHFGAQMEPHKKYCDLQYIVSGNEKIYWPSLRKLTVVDDHTEDGDYLLYESGVD